MHCNDDTMKKGTALEQWEHVFFEGGRKLSRPFTVVEDELQRKGVEEVLCRLGVEINDPTYHRGCGYSKFGSRAVVLHRLGSSCKLSVSVEREAA